MEKINFKSFDGLEIYGHLSQPSSKNPAPGIVLISGGIHGSVYNSSGDYDLLHIDIVRYLNEVGFATFIIDKRGSKGYGPEYMSHLDMCGKEVDDVIAGARYFKNLEGVLDNQITIHGTSRSATTAALAIAKSDIFNAGILASGFYDIYTQYKYEEVHRPEIFPTKQSLGDKTLKEIPYFQRSPINHINQITCPILLVCGLDDTIVLPERSKVFYERLIEEGKYAKMIHYEKFAHLKEYSYPSKPIGAKYWEDCLDFLKRIPK